MIYITGINKDYFNTEKYPDNQIFIDYTYKIVPVILKGYKLLVMYTYDFKNKKSILLLTALVPKETYKVINRIFTELYMLYNFKPTKYVTDFSLSNIKGIKYFCYKFII